MEQKEIEILNNLGFVEPDSYEKYNFDDYFNINPEYYYRTNFSVEGDHSYDVVDILYVENLEVKGFYYSSSLIDELYASGYEKEVNEVFNRVKAYLKDNDFIHGDFVFVKKSRFNWFVIKCELDEEWKVKRNLAEFTKATVIIDYFAKEISKEYNKQFFVEDSE